ncbi:MAG: flagella basal body P-ring formation protein FlgA [Planctomycetaceae bacterium]|jgi:flagella basal body P-ring formation protein FlgA
MMLKQTILVCFMACGLSATASAAHAAIVRLHSSVTVDKALIHLGDVADIFADDDQTAAKLQMITLSTSPIPGNSARMKLDQIRSRLLKFDVEIGALEFQGSSIVLVTRRGQLPVSTYPSNRTTLAKARNRVVAPRTMRRTELAGYATTTPRTISNLSNIATSDIRLAENVIQDLVRDYLSEWASDWGTPIIHPLLAIQTVPTILSARSGNLKIVSGKPVSEDIFLLTVAIPTGEVSPAGTNDTGSASDKSNVETVQVRVRVTRRPKVLAARRAITQGQVIREADLEWQEVDDLRNGTADPETVVGMEARRTIRQGDFVKESSVKPPTLIRRDEDVNITVKFGSIQVTRTFKARRDGTLNDIIELVPIDSTSKKTFAARVIGQGQAKLLDLEADDKDSGIRLTNGEG